MNLDQLAAEAWHKLPGRPNLLYREEGIAIIKSAIEKAIAKYDPEGFLRDRASRATASEQGYEEEGLF